MDARTSQLILFSVVLVAGLGAAVGLFALGSEDLALAVISGVVGWIMPQPAPFGGNRDE